MAYIGTKDYWLEHAIGNIFADYGDSVTAEAKNKDLNKFGFTAQCQTTATELQRLPTGTFNETDIYQNLITTISSANASDTGDVKIEGHTVGSDVSVSTLTQTTGTATCTTGAVHGHTTGDWVYISGANEAGYNGKVQVTVTNTTVFTYTVDAATATPATGTILSTNQNKTFVVQTVTLQGQTQVTLGTALNKSSRFVVPPQNRATNIVGTVYVYENDTTAGTPGVPDTAAKVHLMNGTNGAINNSLKASTSISSADYFVVTFFHAHFEEKTAGFATVTLQVREQGGVWLEKEDLTVSDNQPSAVIEFKPYLIIPKNADVRLIGEASANGKDVGGSFEGVLLT